mgnify:CR=1 FL=1
MSGIVQFLPNASHIVPTHYLVTLRLDRLRTHYSGYCRIYYLAHGIRLDFPTSGDWPSRRVGAEGCLIIDSSISSVGGT